MTRKLLESGQTMEPYKHDCDKCVWVGWFSPYKNISPMNIYICPGNTPDNPTVIIRFSDEPSDYWSHTAGDSIKGGIRAL